MELVCPDCLALNRVPDARLADGPRCGQCKQPLLPGTPLDLTADTFDRFVSHAGLPVLVDFWASWCGPCKMMAPVFKQVAADYASRLRFAKVETEAHPKISLRAHIKSIPTLVLYQGGDEVARVAGAMDAVGLKRWLAQHGVK